MHAGVLAHPTTVVIASKILLCDAAKLLWAMTCKIAIIPQHSPVSGVQRPAAGILDSDAIKQHEYQRIEMLHSVDQILQKMVITPRGILSRVCRSAVARSCKVAHFLSLVRYVSCHSAASHPHEPSHKLQLTQMGYGYAYSDDQGRPAGVSSTVLE